MSSKRTWERVAGTASIVAAAVHGALTPTHFQQWWGYGSFFLLATAAQTVLGLALALDALEGSVARARHAMYVWGIVGTALLMAMYLVTRTIGIPFLGPDAGLVEGVATLDVVAQTAQLVTVFLLARLAWAIPRDDDITPSSSS